MLSDLVNTGIMHTTDNVSSLVGTTSSTSFLMHYLAAATTSTPLDEGTCELASHTDTCVVGNNFVILKKADHFNSVHPFAEEYKPLWNIPIAIVATVWIHK